MTMRATQTCPGCSGKKFAVTEEFRHLSGHGHAPLRAVTVDDKLGLFRGGMRTELGTFESWICLGCGYTEFYAKGLDGIGGLAEQFPEHLTIIDATSKRGPYR
jgi:hypothetical protein